MSRNRAVADAVRAFDPDELASFRTALKSACDQWDLKEPLTDTRRPELATAILEAAQVGFSGSDTLARIALDRIRIANAGPAGRRP